jgi:hypothetical protein
MEVLRFKRNGADVVRPYTGFSYNSYASQHVAFTKKAGTYSYYFRKSDTGASGGPNLVTLFEIRDNGDTWQGGWAQCASQNVLANYSQTRWVTGDGRGWRAINGSNGTTLGDLTFQGTTDNFSGSGGSFNALGLKTNGDVELYNGVLTGQRLEINKFATADSFGYIDICAQPGSDADTRIWRDAGANGGFSIQNGGSGNLGVYTGGTAGQPWTANKGFHINGSNGTLYLTGGLVLENNQSINFRDANGTYPSMLTQSDNNWVFYGTGSTGAARPIMSCFMRSDTEPFWFAVPLEVEGNPVGGSGSIVKTAYVGTSSVATMTATIALATSGLGGGFPPSPNQGTGIITTTFTRSSTNNKVRGRLTVYGSVNAAGATISALIVRDGTTVHAGGVTVPTANYAVNLHFEFLDEPGAFSISTGYTVTVGPTSGTMTLNGTNGIGRYSGFTADSSLVLEEIRA